MKYKHAMKTVLICVIFELGHSNAFWALLWPITETSYKKSMRLQSLMRVRRLSLGFF